MTANGASYETAPPPNCPKCGKPLNVYRLLQIANDQRNHLSSICATSTVSSCTLSDGLKPDSDGSFRISGDAWRSGNRRLLVSAILKRRLTIPTQIAPDDPAVDLLDAVHATTFHD